MAQKKTSARKTAPVIKPEKQEVVKDAGKEMEKSGIEGGIELVWMDPRTMQPYEGNPKMHTSQQRVAYEELKDDVGWIGALLFNKRTQHLLDGHMRQEEALEKNLALVPVLVVDIPEEKEPTVVMLLDSVGQMYRIRMDKLKNLKRAMKTDSEKLKNLVARIRPDGAIADLGELSNGEGEIASAGSPIGGKSLPEGGIALTLGREYNYIVLMFDRSFDFQAAKAHFGIVRQKCVFTSATGEGRVVNGIKYLRSLEDEESS